MPTNKTKNSAERVPPQNLDAEKSLLGAILISEESLPDITEIVKPQDFYDERHQHIFSAMWNLYERHQPVDLLTVRDELKKKKLTEKAGGSAYLSELASFVPTAAHAKAYAELVSDTAVRRRLIKAASEISEKAYEDDGFLGIVLSKNHEEAPGVSDLYRVGTAVRIIKKVTLPVLISVRICLSFNHSAEKTMRSFLS